MVEAGVCTYILVGWGQVNIFYELAWVGGGIFWMVGGKWKYFLCDWILLMGRWGRVWGNFWVHRGGWTFFMGEWGQVEVYFG